jgi:hypothetical protein
VFADALVPVAAWLMPGTFDFHEIPRTACLRIARPASGIAFARDGYRSAKPQGKPNFTIGA